MGDLCYYCKNKGAIHGCEMCGSNICENCKLNGGCRVCGGGVRSI